MGCCGDCPMRREDSAVVIYRIAVYNVSRIKAVSGLPGKYE